MGANSGGLTALIGTIAGVVGAIAVIIQVFQGETPSVQYGSWNSRRNSSRLGLNQYVAELLARSLWTVSILLVAWLVINMLRIRQNTIPIYSIVALPALLAAGLTVRGLLLSWNSLSFGRVNIFGAIWATIASAIDIFVIVAALKIIR